MSDIQQIEEQQHGRDGIDVYGVLCATAEEAAYVAGCDTAADLQEEWEYREQYERDRALDDLEIHGAQFGVVGDDDDFIPF